MIKIKTPQEIAAMREAGKILAHVFDVVGEHFKVGVNAGFLDDLIRETIRSFGAQPSFLGFSGYQYSSCISKNEEVVHGIPYPTKIMLPGDICSIDIGVHFNGFHADAARIYSLGPVSPEVQSLIDVTEECFFKAAEVAIEGNRMGDISHAIQAHAEKYGFSVVRDLYSHGIGRELHEEPLIPNYGKPNKGTVLKEGMTFAIEPMINMGSYDVLTLQDKWTIITCDKKWSAHYENTLCIGKTAPEILTMPK
jgi:methionyl aminopeptidase